jgi:hypothetical protein
MRHQIADTANRISDLQQIGHEIAHEIARVTSEAPVAKTTPFSRYSSLDGSIVQYQHGVQLTMDL